MEEFKSRPSLENGRCNFTNAVTDPELVDPSSPELIHEKFNELGKEIDSLFIREDDKIVDANTDDVQQIGCLLSNLYNCLSEKDIINDGEISETGLLIFIHIILMKFADVDDSLKQLIVDLTEKIFLRNFKENANSLIEPLIEITLNSSELILDRCSSIMMNCMAEYSSKNSSLHDLQIMIHSRISGFFLSIIDTCPNQVLLRNIFGYFGNLLYQSWTNLDLMSSFDDEMIPELCRKSMPFLLPLDIHVTPCVTNLIAELARFTPFIPLLKDLNVVNIICDVLIAHQKIREKIENSEEEDDDDYTPLDEKISSNGLQVILIITNEEKSKDQEISFLKNEHIHDILKFELDNGYPTTKQFIFMLINSLSGKCWEFFHETGIISYFIERFNSFGYSNKVFNFTSILRFLSYATAEIAKSYLTQETIDLFSDMIDPELPGSTEALMQFLISMIDDDILEIIRQSDIPDKIVDFVDTAENCENATKILEMIEGEDDGD